MLKYRWSLSRIKAVVPGMLFYGAVIGIAVYLQFFNDKASKLPESQYPDYDRVMNMQVIPLAVNGRKGPAVDSLNTIERRFKNINCEIDEAYLFIHAAINVNLFNPNDLIPLNSGANMYVQLASLGEGSETLGGHIIRDGRELLAPESINSSVYLYSLKDISYRPTRNDPTKEGRNITSVIGKNKEFRTRVSISFSGGDRVIHNISIHYTCKDLEICHGNDFNKCLIKPIK